MKSLKVQFLGRFAYLHSLVIEGKRKGRSGRNGKYAKSPKDRYAFSVIANNLAFNKTLGLGAHHVRLVIPRRLMAQPSRGVETANATFAVAKVGGLPEEFIVWDIEGCDVTFRGVNTTGGVEFQEKVPAIDLLAQVPGSAVNVDVLSRAVLDTPVSARFLLEEGTLETDQLVPDEVVDLRTYETLGMPSGRKTVPAADVATWSTEAKNFVEIVLRRFTDSETKLIHLDGPGPFAVAVVNTCAHSSLENGDVEFAAYYDLLSKPPDLGDRIVPFSVTSGDDSARCYNVCQAEV
jgi:hypothetical protein